MDGFQKHHIPVTGFVIQKNVEAVGSTVLADWIARGFDLGNHTYSHADFNGLSAEEFESEIVGGEAAIAPLMKGQGKKLAFFRFPFNHSGDTKEKHDRIAAFLAERGYSLAACTIDNSDYVFNRAYMKMAAAHDEASAKRLRNEYIAYTGAEIDYYAGLGRQVLGYEPPEVMLLHDNRLNADVIEAVLRLFEDRRYRFVSLREALSDPTYRVPETYVTKFGPMWGYRWAKERKVQVNGSLEPEPAKWVSEYGGGLPQGR